MLLCLTNTPERIKLGVMNSKTISTVRVQLSDCEVDLCEEDASYSLLPMSARPRRTYDMRGLSFDDFREFVATAAAA